MTSFFLSILLFRIINSFITQTYFQPDEFWQGLEPAHRLVYGYGYLTWEWRDALRSIVHPLVFATVYSLCDLLRLGSIGLIYGPKLVQAFFAALTDIFTYSLANKLYGVSVAKYALLCSLLSAMNFHVGVRTFSNSMECTISICAMNYWPFARQSTSPGSLRIALVLASLACIMRPTNVLIWLYLGSELFLRQKSLHIIFLAASIGLISLALNALIDMLYYNRVVFPMLEFLKFNVIESLSSFYGTNQAFYYIIEALPQLTILYFPLLIHGWFISRYSVLSKLCIFVIIIYSFNAHKEVRFIYPLLPVMHIMIARSLDSWTTSARHNFKRYYLYAVIGIHGPLCIYLATVHQRGVIDVTHYIRNSPEVTSVGFLMPCHSTPWMSHIHRQDISAWFLTCEPPRGTANLELESYLDEADIFYENPVLFLESNFPSPGSTDFSSFAYSWPSHLVFFETLKPQIDIVVMKSNLYRECAKFFNSHAHEDHRRRGDVIVYCQT
ncbi:Alg9-like mannosyltransferase family-domain-containing protein [Lipomyces oligophaga]|uniref:Alg9-like mannosyltransferase family-domain-containing protein n=1 Tax=Lipomyces oligophaga TaxID=45792 RepID=UPI0034CE13D3